MTTLNLKDSLSKGTLELAILYLLSQKDMYGYEISQTIYEKSTHEFKVNSAAMYSALFRLTEDGYVTSYEQTVGQKMVRVYYHLEPAGKAQLDLTYAAFIRQQQAISSIFDLLNINTI